MRVHPRHNDVTFADLAIREAVVAAAEKHRLTFAELTSILGNVIAGWSKSQVKLEREDESPQAVQR